MERVLRTSPADSADAGDEKNKDERGGEKEGKMLEQEGGEEEEEEEEEGNNEDKVAASSAASPCASCIHLRSRILPSALSLKPLCFSLPAVTSPVAASSSASSLSVMPWPREEAQLKRMAFVIYTETQVDVEWQDGTVER